MEDMMMMMKKQPCWSNITTNQSPSSSSSPLATHKDSQTISKVKPKIRIIHIFAPEIIKTDVENFRELVQRLTGKPSADRHHLKGSRNKNKKSRIAPRKFQDHHHQPINNDNLRNKPAEPRNSGGMAQVQVKKEEEEEEEEEKMWNYEENSGGFLSGFSDLDGFIQELDDFSMLQPIEANHMHGFGEIQLI